MIHELERTGRHPNWRDQKPEKVISICNSTVLTVAGSSLEFSCVAGLGLHFLAKLFEFCQKILIFLQHISFRLTNQLKK